MRGVLLGLYPGSSEDFSVETSLHDEELMLFQVRPTLIHISLP